MCVLAATLLSSVAVAQTGSGAINGRVFSPAGELLEKARISVGDINLVANSNSNGEFRLTGVPAGTHTLTCSFIGLQPASVDVEVIAGQTVTQDFNLSFGGEVEVRSAPLLVGQAKALNRQKNAINITNIVAADQIGRFPDKNAAEATQRVPAISLERDQGEGRYVIIRGTEARLNSTTVNGERIPSPEAGVRNIALDTIPSDLLESIKVSKALTPDMDGDAIGGTVDLVTQRAPEERRISVGLGGTYKAITEETAPGGNFAYGQRFGDKDFGLLISGSGTDVKGGSDNVEPEYDDGDLDELQMRDYTIERERYGLTADLDYRASDQANYYFRGLYTNYIDTEIRRAKVNVVGDGELERAIRDRQQESDIFSLRIGGENVTSSALVIDYHLMWNRSQEETPDQVTTTFIQEDVEFDPNVSPDSIDPNNIQANPLNEDPDEFWFDEIETEAKKAVDEDWVAAINFTNGFYRDASFSGLWKAGAKGRFKTKEQNYDVFAWESEDDLNMAPFIDGWRSETPFFNGIYGNQMYPFYSPDAMRELLASGQLEGERLLDEDLADFTVDEDTLAAYGMAEFFFGGRTSLLGGLRVESTTNDYLAYELVIDEEGDPLDIAPVTGDKSYTEWLPQFHLVYRLDDDSQLRAAITRSLSRANYEDLAPWRLVNDEDGEIELGNPDLDVTTAWNADLMYERYLDPIGVVSAGLFYKKLYDNIFIFQVEEEIDGIDYEITQPRNGDDAELWGLEMAFQNQFTNWNGFWGGFGLYFNYTYVDSEANYPERETTTLQGQSEHVGNIAVVYEKYGLSTRLSYNYNSKYLIEVGEDPEEDLYVDDHGQLDFLARFQFTNSFSVVLEVINITDEPFTVFENTADRIRQQEYYSWWATLGVRFDF